MNRFEHTRAPASVDKQTVIRMNLLGLAADMTSFEASFGRKEDVDPVHHLIATAAGWGGLPDREATYVGVSPGLPVGEYELTVGADVPELPGPSLPSASRDPERRLDVPDHHAMTRVICPPGSRTRVYVRCRAKNRVASSPSNRGTPVCPPMFACSVFSSEP